MQEEDLRCSWPRISSYNKSFPPWMCMDCSLLGVRSFVSLYQPLDYFPCSLDRVISSGEAVEICVFLVLGCNPCNWISFVLNPGVAGKNNSENLVHDL